MANAKARVAALLTAVGGAALFWRKRSGATEPATPAAEPADMGEVEPDQ